MGIETNVNEWSQNDRIITYPNPFTDKKAVLLPRLLRQTKIQVMNAVGWTLMKYDAVNTNPFLIDLSGLANGVYLIEVSDEISKTRAKLLKQ